MIRDNLLGELEALGRTVGLTYLISGPDGLPQPRNAAAVALGAISRIQALEALCSELREKIGQDKEG